jgi:indolepyruvate decarboxylase
MPPTGTLGSKGWRRVHRPLLAQAEPLALPGSDPLSLERVVRTVLDRLAGARSAFLLAGMLVRRTANRERLRALLDASGLPFTTMFMGKSVLDEHHSGYIGIYDGALMNEEVRAFVEGADLVLNVGALMTDFNTGAFTANLSPARIITIAQHHVEIDSSIIAGLEMGDVLSELAKRIEHRSWPRQEPSTLGPPVDFSIVCRLFQQGCRGLVCDAASKSIETGALMRQRPFLGLGLQAQEGFHGVQRKGLEQ